MSDTKKPARTRAADGQAYDGFTDEERAAMKEHGQELKKSARRGSQASKDDGEGDVLAKIAELQDPDRVIAERIHAIVKAVAPDLAPRTYYGMPAYAKGAKDGKGGKVLCWYQPAQKFKTRYGMFSFTDQANLDGGAMWPVAYALAELTADAEAEIAARVKQAVS
jgi:uncharacterized protein YdhG (YjbR/CyaY superfamily)